MLETETGANLLVRRALQHLHNAISAGWRDFVYANHDPTLADIVQHPEYRSLMADISVE